MYDYAKEMIYKLNDIESLKDNWNHNGAKAFSKGLIEECKAILDYILPGAFINPTTHNSIRFEYTKSNGSYLEFEVCDKSKYGEYKVSIYCKGKDGRPGNLGFATNLEDIRDITIAFLYPHLSILLNPDPMLKPEDQLHLNDFRISEVRRLT